jgi:chromosome partitioning protein
VEQLSPWNRDGRLRLASDSIFLPRSGIPAARTARGGVASRAARQLDPFGLEIQAVKLSRAMTQHDSANPPACRVVAVVNQKGGVGKTTTAINLATAIALTGRRVLLIDIDPQANLTSGIGARGQRAEAGTVYEALLEGGTPEHYVMSTTTQGLFVIPADRSLTGAEIELVPVLERETRLKAVVEPLRPSFDYIFIDSPPSLGLLTLNAMVAADSALVPLHCEYFALEGLAELVGTLRRVRASLNPVLELEGVLLTMYDDRTNLGQQVARDVRGFFKEKVFDTIIPRNVRLGEAPSHGIPGVLYDVKARGAAAYLALANELLTRTARSDSTKEGHDE